MDDDDTKEGDGLSEGALLEDEEVSEDEDEDADTPAVADEEDDKWE